MSEERPTWAKQMENSPFRSSHFSAELKQQVLKRAKVTRRTFKFPRIAIIIVPLAFIMLLIGLSQQLNGVLPFRTPYIGNKPNVAGMERTAYYKQDRLLFTVYPEADVRAGVMAGYIFHFEESIDTYKGKTMTIQAQHMRSGQQETISLGEIAGPSSGYETLERLTARFALPLGGVWTLEVLLDDQKYGNVVLSLLDPSWEVSPEFRSGSYLMRGISDQVGFIDAGFVAGKQQKYMWHFWGSDEQLNGPFDVKAVKEGSDHIIDVFSTNPLLSSNALGGKLNGADRHTVSSMKLPEKGTWRLLPYVRGRLLDTIVVEVK
ncbi:DUF4871 domain-containing protein [Paenibacillus sp. 2TAB23]|uniref:DUF4871 domain-containing protein n=1 Tax=Paenibacillus sp. 2TAB23 TaxID=3233004 RepID=UPI003F9C0146